MTPIETIRIPLSKTKLLLFIVLYLTGVAANLWVLIWACFGPNSEPWLVYAAGGFGLALFGGFLAAYVRKLLDDDRIGLVIDAEGLIVHSSLVSVGRIPWSDIAGVTVGTGMWWVAVAILPHNQEEYIARLSGLKRVNARASTLFHGSPRHIRVNTLEGPFDQLYQRLSVIHKRYQADALQEDSRREDGERLSDTGQ